MAAELAPRVRTLTRRVATYHYTTRTKMGLPSEGAVALDDPRVEEYLRERSALYWDPRFEPAPGHPIWGLYVATDPVSSRVFGGFGEDWALVRVTLPRGLRFLEVRTADAARRPEDRLPAAVREELAAAGCEAAYAADLVIDRGSLACREVALRTLLDLEVDALLYDFKAVDYPACDGSRNGAFLLLRAEALELPAARAYTAPPPADGPAAEEGRAIGELFARARAAGSTQRPIWPAPDDQVAPSAATERWMRETLFACGGYAEDRLDGRPAAAPADPAAAAELRALAAERAGDDAAAAAAWEEVLRHDPDRVEALYGLAWLRATSPAPGVRDPERAVEAAEWLVELTHYMQRRSTVGFDWPRHLKLRASWTVAVAYLAAGRWDRGVAYATQAVETAAAQHRAEGTPLSARAVERGGRILALARARKPYEAGGPGRDFESFGDALAAGTTGY